MSNSKTAINEIKKLMKQFGFMSDDASLKSFKLEDNTILEASELKVGESITRLSDEFERVALEDGKFRLVENFEIEVKNSKIIKVQQIFVDAKLEDGTQIRVEGDSLVEGAKVVVVTEEGEMPAPDGVHTLEDGTKVETKEGVIAMVEEKIAEEQMEDLPMEEKPEVEIEVESKDPIQEIVSLLKDMMEKVSQKMKEMEEKVEEVKADFSKFKSEPAGKKIANGKTDFNKSTNNNEDALQSKLDMIAELRKNNK